MTTPDQPDTGDGATGSGPVPPKPGFDPDSARQDGQGDQGTRVDGQNTPAPSPDDSDDANATQRFDAVPPDETQPQSPVPQSEQPEAEQPTSPQPQSPLPQSPQPSGQPPFPDQPESEPHPLGGQPGLGPQPYAGQPGSGPQPYPGRPADAPHNSGPETSVYAASAAPGAPGQSGSGAPGQGGPGGPGVPPAGGAAAPGGPGQPQQPQGKQKKHGAAFWPLIIAGIVVVALLLVIGIGAAIINSINKRDHGPDQVASQYMNALADGDLDKVRELAPFNLPDDVSDALMSKGYMSDAKSKVSDVKITDTKVDGDNAKVQASYKLGDDAHKIKLTAHKDGKEKLFFDKWRLQAPQLSVIRTAVPDVKGMTVNGKEFTPESGNAMYAVFPGSYEFKVPGAHYYDGATVNSTAGFGDDDKPDDVRISLKGNDTFQKDVEKAVHKKMTDCGKKHKFSPKGCPFKASTGTKSNGKVFGKDVSEKKLKWKVSGSPKINAVLSPNLNSGTFVSKSGYTISNTAPSKSVKGATWKSQSINRYVTGKVKIVDGKSVSITFSHANK